MTKKQGLIYFCAAFTAFFILFKIAGATPTSWDYSSSVLQPLQSQWSAQVKGSYFTATSTTATSTFPIGSSTTFCLSTDCRTAWPAGTNYFTLTGNNLQNNVGTSLGINVAPNFANLEVQASTSAANPFAVWGSAGTSQPYITVLGNGNVGIGTSTPSSLFSITASTTASSTFAVASTGNVTINNTDPISAAIPLSIYNAPGTAATMLEMVNRRAQGTGSGSFGIFASDDGTAMLAGNRLGGFAFAGARDTIHTLNSSVGIVANASADWTPTSAPAYLDFQTTPVGSVTRATAMRIGSDGNVGIGTTSPTSPLTLAGSDSANFGTNSAPGLSIGKNNTGIYVSGGQLAFTQAGTLAGYFSSSATFVLPGRNLSVGGNTVTLNSDSGSSVIVTTTGGNVGISTSTPSSKLDVNGYIDVPSATGGFKMDTLQYLVASSTTGTLQLGFSAGGASKSASTGSTFIGDQAGVNTTGASNIMIGYQAGKGNTTGSGNFYMGGNTGLFQQDTTNNIALGFQAMQGNSGQAQSSNGNNVAIGYAAFANRSTGYFNVAIGANALDHNTTGPGNVAIGYLSLDASVGGQLNTSIGYSAGSLATGNTNIFIGEQAATNQTSGNNNIVIGSAISSPLATGSNQLNIGNIIFGTGISGTGTTTAGNIGIGTSTPAVSLDVNGQTLFEPVADPATTSNGTHWYSSIAKAFSGFIDGIQQWFITSPYVMTTQNVVANTNSETSILGTAPNTSVGTTTLPANFWVAGKSVTIHLGGVYSTKTITPGNLTIKVKWGSTTLASETLNALLSAASGAGWDGDVLITCLSVSGGNCTFSIAGHINYAVANPAATNLAPIYGDINNSGSTVVADITSSQRLDVTATWATADVANVATTTASVMTVMH